MLGRLINPLSVLITVVVLYTANRVATGYDGEYPSAETEVVYALAFSLLLTWWVYGDRRKNHRSVPFELEAFVFFAWPIVVPAYLIQTRRWWSIPAIACLYGAIALPYIVDIALHGY